MDQTEFIGYKLFQMSIKLASVFFFEDGYMDFMEIIQIIPEWFKSCFLFLDPEY